MMLELALTNFVSPPILFFFLGMCASFLDVDLNIPNPLPKFLSLYLLLVIGFEGGVELYNAGLGIATLIPLVACVLTAIIIPLCSFFVLRTRLNEYDASVIAATYGSVSAVTFITATTLLQALNIPFGGYMVAALALMESPAIIVGLYLVQRYAANVEDRYEGTSLMREAFLNSSVFLILGSLVIGFVSGNEGALALKPFTHDIFKGMLSFFMLDMGLLAAKRMQDIKKTGVFLFLFALIAPVINGLLGIAIGYCIGLGVGDMLLLTVLCASASYIAVPAAMRLAVPEANPSLYIPMALGITFPLNILIGLPVYLQIIQYIKG